MTASLYYFLARLRAILNCCELLQSSNFDDHRAVIVMNLQLCATLDRTFDSSARTASCYRPLAFRPGRAGELVWSMPMRVVAPTLIVALMVTTGLGGCATRAKTTSTDQAAAAAAAPQANKARTGLFSGRSAK
eukprot:gene33954-56647_t